MRELNGRVKGAAFRESALWLREQLGADALRSAIECVPPEHLRLFDADSPTLGILAATWYPAEAASAFLNAIFAGMPREREQEMVTAATQAALGVTLTGVHRAVMRVVGNPDRHVRFAQLLWNTHFDTGQVRVERLQPRKSRIAYSDWSGHGRILCMMCAASDLVIYSVMGCEGVEVERESCIDRGQAFCSHLVTWSG
jgi:hypothetical protein